MDRTSTLNFTEIDKLPEGVHDSYACGAILRCGGRTQDQGDLRIAGKFTGWRHTVVWVETAGAVDFWFFGLLSGKWATNAALGKVDSVPLSTTQRDFVERLTQAYGVDASKCLAVGQSAAQAIGELIAALEAGGYCGSTLTSEKPTDIKAQRKKDGVCVECGDRGESRGCVWFCKNGHGKIF